MSSDGILRNKIETIVALKQNKIQNYNEEFDSITRLRWSNSIVDNETEISNGEILTIDLNEKVSGGIGPYKFTLKNPYSSGITLNNNLLTLSTENNTDLFTGTVAVTDTTGQTEKETFYLKVSPIIPDLSSPDADFIISNVFDNTITIQVLSPAEYVGTYPNIDLSILAQGIPINLKLPVISGGPTGTLTALPGLWIYSTTAYSSNATSFIVEYAWVTEDNSIITGANDLTWNRSTYRAIRFREIATGVTGPVEEFSAELAAITVPAATFSASRGIVPTAGLLKGHRAMSFAVQATFTTSPVTGPEDLITNGTSGAAMFRRDPLACNPNANNGFVRLVNRALDKRMAVEWNNLVLQYVPVCNSAAFAAPSTFAPLVDTLGIGFGHAPHAGLPVLGNAVAPVPYRDGNGTIRLELSSFGSIEEQS